MRPSAPTPGRPSAGRPGVFLWCAILLVLACDGEGVAGRELELDGETVRLPPGTAVHDVHLGVEDGRARIRPDTVRAEPGDIIQFIAGDDRGYAVVFDRALLADTAAAFLERTDQLRGPPLIQRGTRWIVDLSGAPSGRYPFVCLTHDARGLIVVAPS